MAVWSVTTPPASEPLELAEVKNYLRIASAVTADDNHITAMIIEAREFVERVTGRALITQTITEYFDSFPALSQSLLTSRVIPLYIGPVISITEATGLSYIAVNGTPASYTAWDNTGNSKYFLDIVSGGRGIGPARICKKDGVDWPTIQSYTNAVKVVYSAGYGAAANVPGPIKRAMYKLIGQWYYHPELSNEFELVEDLLNPYKIHK
jgi:uncharacterized phiE125 gp8 family phage protein